MSTMALWLAAVLTPLIGILGWLVLRLSYRDGQQDERHDHDTARQNTVQDAARIRDRLVHDAAFARRVRERFSR